jgi:hypothetical protein
MGADMSYIRPERVLSPRAKGIEVVEVLLDEGESTDEASKFAAAIIKWDRKTYVGTRWNGSARNPAGFPTSRGKPIWQVEHEELGTQLEALFRAKAKGQELDWVPPLKVEQLVSELAKKGFCVTLAAVPTPQHQNDRVIMTAIKDAPTGAVEGMQFCLLSDSETWLGNLLPVSEFEALLRVAGVFPPESVESVIKQVRERGQIVREGLSLTCEQIDALRLRKAKRSPRYPGA